MRLYKREDLELFLKVVDLIPMFDDLNDEELETFYIDFLENEDLQP